MNTTIVMPRPSSKHNKFRPRRRASQTHFFKYQLACNPIKAEEDALKRALLESLQQYESNEHVQVKKVRPLSPALKSPEARQHPTPTKSTKRKNSESNNNNGISVNLNTIDQSNSTYYDSNSNCSMNNSNKSNNSNAFTINNNFMSNSTAKIKNKYKPETEDFLTFICFRSAASQDLHEHDRPSTASNNHHHDQLNGKVSPTSLPQSTSSSDTTTSSSATSSSLHNATSTAKDSPNRRQTRHSLRLSSNRKISENAVNSKAFDNSVSYEENFKRAKMALEDMQQEVISNFDDEPKLSIDKHLVKGLMSREFAGAFADEETMFDSI